MRLSRRVDRLHVWSRLGEQRQAFNRGVGLCLGAAEADKRLPSTFDLHKQLTADRASGRMPTDVPVHLQRPGLEAGRDAVAKWDKARYSHEQSVVYWAARLAAAELTSAADTASAKAVLAAVDNRAALKKTPAKEQAYCEKRLDKASTRRDRHEERGTRRLFRSRKMFETQPRQAPALVYRQGARLGSDGTIRLPGGHRLRLSDPLWQPTAGYEWTGAVQIVDVTRKVTSRTRPEHRRYAVHANLVRSVDPLLRDPVSRDEVIGIDAGCVVNVAVSDGRMMNLPDETGITAQIKDLQQQRSRCDYGSRKWEARSRELRRLYDKRTARREYGTRKIAASVASTHGIAAVGAEKTNTKAMMGSAAGTAVHPGSNVAAKRGLNRSLSDARFGGIRRTIERACDIRGVAYVSVPAAGTSQFCNKCGARVVRESQSTYWCRACGIVGHADTNAATNVQELAWGTFGEPKPPGGKGLRRHKRIGSEGNGPNRSQTATVTEALTNKGIPVGETNL